MRPTSLTRLASQRLPLSATQIRASSSQAGPSKPPKSTQKRLPKSVLRDLVKLHHTSSSFMYDPSQLPAAFETAFRSGAPEYTRYEEFHNAHITRSEGLVEYDPNSPSGIKTQGEYARVDNVLRSKDIVPTFGFVEGKWSDAGVRGFPISERDKLVREALFGTFERGPREDVRPALEGVEEWLQKEGKSVEDVAKEWEERHSEVHLGQKGEEGQ